MPLYQGIAADKATTMGHIQRKHLKETLINVPDKLLFEKANKILNPIFEQIKTNRLQVETLTDLRDSLLPKLMSGKIELK